MMCRTSDLRKLVVPPAAQQFPLEQVWLSENHEPTAEPPSRIFQYRAVRDLYLPKTSPELVSTRRQWLTSGTRRNRGPVPLTTLHNALCCTVEMVNNHRPPMANGYRRKSIKGVAVIVDESPYISNNGHPQQNYIYKRGT